MTARNYDYTMVRLADAEKPVCKPVGDRKNEAHMTVLPPMQDRLEEYSGKEIWEVLYAMDNDLAFDDVAEELGRSPQFLAKLKRVIKEIATK